MAMNYGPSADYSQLWRQQAEANNAKWRGLDQPAPAQPMIRIAPPAAMSANAQKVMAQAMGMPSRNWGEALSKLGNTWAAKHAGEREAEARQLHAGERDRKRADWIGALSEGATPQFLAYTDSNFVDDKEFHAWWKSNQPAPTPETFENVLDPYGFGGAAQRSSATGKLVNYQGAPAAKDAPRPTAKDRRGRLRYLDTGEAAFSDELLGPDPTPTTTEISMPDKLKMVRQLSDDWSKTVKPMQVLLAQSDRMDIGLQMAQRGDMLAGSQAILISFNKLLDPDSVVRESEYSRSATGQSALETMRGFVDKLSKGGAGVTLAELESYRRFGQQVVQKALQSTVAPERARISRLVEFAGVDPQLIFPGRFATPEGPQQAAPQGGGIADAAPQAPIIDSSQAMMAEPTGQRGPAPQADAARIKMYGRLPPDALKRQAQEMKRHPYKYGDAERRAMAHAWRAKFGE